MTGFKQARLGLLFATLAIAAAGGARAEEGVAFKNLLGNMGVIPKDKDPIRYRERAPLVLPPKMELPTPASSDSYASAHPEWPNDPDTAARKRRIADERKPVTESEIRRQADRRPELTIDEIRRGRGKAADASVPGQYMNEKVVMTDDAPRVSGKKDDATASNDPVTRRTLTDPPTLFRTPTRTAQTGSASTPRIDQQQADANPMDWLTRKFRHNDDDE